MDCSITPSEEVSIPDPIWGITRKVLNFCLTPEMFNDFVELERRLVEQGCPPGEFVLAFIHERETIANYEEASMDMFLRNRIQTHIDRCAECKLTVKVFTNLFKRTQS